MAGSIAVHGEALIDLIDDGHGSYRAYPGGSPFNVAIGLARQGMAVSYLSPLSNDNFGDQLHAALDREGVEVPIRRRSRCPTSLAVVNIDEQGAPNYQLYRNGVADKDTSFDEIASHLPDDATVFHTGSLAITPSQLPRIRRLLELMRSRDITISMDINIRLCASVDPKSYLDGVRSLLPLVDIVKASDEDFEPFQFAMDTRKAAALAYEEMGSGILVLTEGKGGALLHTEDGVVETAAYSITDVEDTVGAGDTFHSAFLAALVRGGAIDGRLRGVDPNVLKAALDFACAAAAINVSLVGCDPPTQAEVEDFLLSAKR